MSKTIQLPKTLADGRPMKKTPTKRGDAWWWNEHPDSKPENRIKDERLIEQIIKQDER